MTPPLTPLAWCAWVALAVLVLSLLRLSCQARPPRAWDQWHHGWLLLAALPLPLWVRWSCFAIGCDDALNHLMDTLFGWHEMSPLALAYRLACRLLGISG